jgi:hypothetical protein
MTIVDQLKKMHQDVTEQVTARTGLTHDELMNIIFETGVQYIERLAGNPIAQTFLKERLFWAWWNQQWAMMDQIFLNRMKGDFDQSDILEIYRRFHADIDVYPDPVIWDQIHDSYNKMTQQIIKNTKKTRHASQQI